MLVSLNLSSTCICALGTGGATKTDDFADKFERGGGAHFQSKNLYRRFWTFFRRFPKKNAIKISENEGGGGV